MTHRCHECSRLNPAEATFCYFDGVALNGRNAVAAGSIDFSSWAFPSPFVFPGGQQCHNFLQLALACHNNRQEAIEILRGGFLDSFLGSLGRVDLALVARAAARSPDPERGLDDLLGKLPGSPLRPAQLQVEPVEKSLGIVPVGEDHHFELTFTNLGDRLLHGKAMIESCPWLGLGDGAASEKLFQFSQRSTLPVHVRGKHLRAYAKPQKAEIALESNGGNILVTVHLTVPIKPFPEGVLSGATTPRQLAEKAKAHPKEAAVLIENGAVAAWYQSNGWTYPVQGPTASGIAAVQQLFEMLGLVRSPRVEVSESAVTLRGSPGARLEYVVTVQTQEKRAAVAHGASDQPWLSVGKTVFRGQQASIPLIVQNVPAEPGRTLTAQLKVTANGNQRFDIPVSLVVAEGDGTPLAAAPPSPAPLAPLPVPEPSPFAFGPPAAAPTPAPVLVPAAAVQVMEASPFSNLADPLPAPVAVAPMPEAPPVAATPVRRPRPWKQLLPIAIVVVGLLTALVRDLLLYEPAEEPLPEVDYANPGLDIRFHDRPLADDFVTAPSMRFGLGIPDPSDARKLRTRLVYDEHGRTNNVCVRINGSVTYLWGVEQGAWKGEARQPLGKDREGHTLIGARSVWVRSGPPNITVTQYAEIVPGGLSADGKKRLLDTCLIRYDITNEDQQSKHRVGLRFLLDTFIGNNDAVPFTIAGARELCDTMKEFKGPDEVPDFISALERQDLTNPGTVAHLSLKYGSGLEPPTRVTLGAWPVSKLREKPGGELAEKEKTSWDVPVLPMGLATSAENPNGDSAVTLYWDDKDLPPKGTRTVGFAYGLGNVSGDKGEGQLGLTAGGALVVDQEFTLTAYVKNPAPGTTITLSLPAGLQLVAGNEKEDVPAVPAGASSPYSPVTWRVKASKYGILPVKATLSTGATVRHRLVVEKVKKFLD